MLFELFILPQVPVSDPGHSNMGGWDTLVTLCWSKIMKCFTKYPSRTFGHIPVWDTSTQVWVTYYCITSLWKELNWVLVGFLKWHRQLILSTVPFSAKVKPERKGKTAVLMLCHSIVPMLVKGILEMNCVSITDLEYGVEFCKPTLSFKISVDQFFDFLWVIHIPLMF